MRSTMPDEANTGPRDTTDVSSLLDLFSVCMTVPTFHLYSCISSIAR